MKLFDSCVSQGPTWRLALVLLLAWCAPVHALSYSAKPMQAKVVDAETGEPVEGANVVAIWELEHLDGSSADTLYVNESVTARDGTFFLPGWGPVEVPKDPEGRTQRLDPNQPHMAIFKSGYKVGLFYGPEGTGYLNDRGWRGDPIRQPYWNGKSIPIHKFVGTELQYARHLHIATIAIPGGGCWWAKNPRATAALINEGERLRKVWGGNNPLVTSEELPETLYGEVCGSRANLQPFLNR